MIRLALALMLLAPTPALVQDRGVDNLRELVREGHYAAVRDSLDRWLERRGELAPGDRAAALLLRARLRSDPAVAESDYLAVILGHPATPEAAEALLRLGQALLASGDASRAAGYLQRLAADYPGHAFRPLGLLWLARARLVEGRRSDACAAARDGLAAAGGDAELGALLSLERSATCRITAGTEPDRARPDPPRTPRPEQGPEPATPGEQAPEQAPVEEPAGDEASESAPYAIQVGAFRSTARAERLVSRLAESGYDARMALVPGSSLVRVRIGRFISLEEADAALGRIRRDGFDAVVVIDAARERPAS